jgi:hypothetical protein
MKYHVPKAEQIAATSLNRHCPSQVWMRCILFQICAVALGFAQTSTSPLNLSWDPGTTDTGTLIATQPSTAAGLYYYRINTRAAEVWRTRLNVTTGEANVYLKKGSVPVIGQVGVSKSDAIGSDGIVLSSADFGPGESWFILVEATGVSNTWSLATGDPFIRDLGSLPYTDSNNDGSYTIGEASQNGGITQQTMPPEGVVFYKATLPPNVPAWALALPGSNLQIGVRKLKVPVLFRQTPVADRRQLRSLLLVPPYLGQGSDSYFVSVVGAAGTVISLDSRIQQIESMNFDDSIAPFQVSGTTSPYRVLRVDVPAGQISWDLTLNRLNGDPSIAIKKETVPSETENDAVNEAPGNVNDSISIVAPALTNGTWFVTIYGSLPFETGLINGPPTILDIGYRDTVVNDHPLRVGWKYYRVPDFAAQVGTLGWQLALAAAPPGTEIAIRRAQIPGSWKRRTGGATTLTDVKFSDFSSTTGVLQRVDHEADIWYVGVYNSQVPLGAFTLTLNDIIAAPLSLDGGITGITDQIESTWNYYRIVIPESQDLQGLYLNLTNVTGTTTPKITVRRDRLPPSTTAVVPTASGWPSGSSWSQDLDFTGLMVNNGGTAVNGQQFLAAKGANRPLVAGTYYVGILAGSAVAPAGAPKKTSYTLQSRAIGTGLSIPITPLNLDGGSVATGLLSPREFRVYSVTIPVGTVVPSWQLDLTPSVGEMMMQVRRNSIPDFFTSVFVGESASATSVAGGKRLKRSGKESLLLLPENGAAAIEPGTYYITTISEGVLPTLAALGTDQASGTLTSTRPVLVTQLGTLNSSSTVTTPVSLKGGDSQIYQFSVPSGTRVLEANLTDRVGNMGFSLTRGALAPVPYPASTSGLAGYGWVGGQTAPNHPVLLTIQEPEADVYTLVVRATAEGSNLADGTANLNLRLVNVFPAIDPVTGSGMVSVTNQIAESWRYFELNIPVNANLSGIRVTLRNVTSGVPRMIIRKGTQLPKDFLTSANLNSDSVTWPVNQQWYQGSDLTGLPNDPGGVIVGGRYFMAAYNAPMDPGSYIIGVSKDASINTVSQPNTPGMSYTVVAEGIGAGMDIPIVPLAFDNTANPEQIDNLPARENKIYQITVPAGQTSWCLYLQESANADTPPKVRDGALAIRRGKIPTFETARDPNVRGGASMRILSRGDYWTLLPSNSNGFIDAGDYFVTVTSQGTGPTASQTGVEPSNLTLRSRGPLPVTNFPLLSETTTQSLPYNLGPAELAAFQFVVPQRASGLTPFGLSLDITRSLGVANYSLIKIESTTPGFPAPPAPGNEGFFGGFNALTTTTDDIGGRLFVEIEPGNYRLIVRSTSSGGTYNNSQGTVSARLLLSTDIPTLPFDGANLTVSLAGATTEVLQYRVEIPDEPNWQAWGLRLDGPVAGKPGIIVRRAQAASTSATVPLVTSDMIDWPLGSQWIQTDDFTKLRNDPLVPSNNAERDRSQQFFMASRERPLQPGTYFIGIDNRATPLVSPRSFTLRTFAVGDGYSIPANDLSTVGAEASVDISTPRMPSVYRISVPPFTRSWAVSLKALLGDLTLRVRYGSVPDPVNDTFFPDAKGGVHVQKSGDERFTLLPRPGNDYLDEGDYFVMAVSEGQNSNLATSLLGVDQVLGTIKNEGPIDVVALGAIGPAGLSQPVALGAAETKVFTLEIPSGINNLEIRLKERSGEASLSVLRGVRIPTPGLSESYGVFGGETAGPPLKNSSIVNLGNPVPGLYTIAVRAGGTLPSSYSPASAILSVNILQPKSLNFAQGLNETNGLSNVDSRTLVDNEKFIYRVPVPGVVGGENVLGWLITLEQGNPTVRIYQSADDFGKPAPVTMVGRSALVVAPFLTFNTNWYIEVEGIGNTDYVIRSEPVRLTAAPWTLPSNFNQLVGDSNPGQPDGQGIKRELPQDSWEFYAVDVGPNNLGLLRLVLEQYGGNTNVYIRNGGIPTVDHSSAGATGTRMFQYRMISEISEAGNFSELSSTTKPPDRLISGRWFIAVKSEPLAGLRTGSGYRLKVHSGVVTDLDLTTSSPLTGQNLAALDWRYYRFTIPRIGIPAEWRPFFNRVSGSSVAYIRDTVPPFSFVPQTSTGVTFNDWNTDLKNRAPAAVFTRALAPGSLAFPTPPLRPGSTYFLGLYGNNSGGSIEVGSAVSSTLVPVDAEAVYNTGVTQITVPGNSSRVVRIATAADATRLKFDCVQSAIGLSLKLEQGSFPYTLVTTTAHRQNTSPFPVAFTFNEVLSSTWPFVPNRDYYLLLSNTTAGPISSTITMKGSSLSTEDEDNDGMIDPWEILYFGNLNQSASGDFDGDGSTNLQEFENGTLPNNNASVRYRMSLSSPGGSVSSTPAQVNYASGAEIQLVATPASGDTFRQWKSSLGSLNAITSPTATLSLSANLTATAIFQTSLGKALETPSSLVYTTAGNGQWYGQYEVSRDGVDCAVSPTLGTNQQARFSTTFTGPGTLKFWWRVSSRANSGRLALLLNNVAQTTPASISGTSGTWSEVTMILPAGSQSIAWRYARDSSSLTDGENRAFVDQISYVPDGFQPYTYTSWLNERFTSLDLANPLISGPGADPDSDGIPNLLEAALGSLPKVANPGGYGLSVVSAGVSGASFNVVLATGRAETPVDNIKLQIQGSPSMVNDTWTTLAEKTGSGNWENLGAGVTAPQEGSAAGGGVPVQITEARALPAGTNRFYRLNASVVSTP